MAEKLHWMRRPFWQSVIILCSLLVWCLYLAACWISSLPLLVQGFLGVAVGITSMASYSATQTQRSHHRRRTSVYLAQLAMADSVALQRLLPNYDKALSWLPNPSDAELVRWINAGLEKAWPYFKEASAGSIKVQLQTVLNKYRSGAIQEVLIDEVNLGNICPYVQGIKPSPIDKDNTVCLEVQLDWRQNEGQEILLRVQTSGMEYAAQVKHFVIFCVMRLTFTHLSGEFPCFGALVISIIEPPLVDFQTRFVSGDVKKGPEMQKAVDSTLVAALMDLLVWPGRVVVPFLPGDYSDLDASCVGHLHVQLVEAKELANKDLAGRSDPYVVLYVRRREDFVKESSLMHGTNGPVWNEQFLFNVEDSTTQKLTIKVMNRDDANLNVFIGNAELAINQLKANTQEDLWIDLLGDPSRLRGKSAGKVHLLIEYKPFNVSSAECDSLDNALRESFPSIAPMTQLAGNNASEGLRTVLDGHSDALQRAQVSQIVLSNKKVEPSKLANDDQLLTEDCKTGSAHCVDDHVASLTSRDRAVIAQGSLLSEDESREKRVNGFGTMETEQGIVTESHELSGQRSWNSSEGSSISSMERRPSFQVDRDVDTDNRLTKRHHIIVGDPAWGLNGLSVKHCNTSAIREDVFSTEIFEVD